MNKTVKYNVGSIVLEVTLEDNIVKSISINEGFYELDEAQSRELYDVMKDIYSSNMPIHYNHTPGVRSDQ